ncbi:MAG: hypothetical protein RJA10_1888, partial [Pseudomonadota bacterium]
ELAAEVNRSGSPATAALLRGLGRCLGLLQQPPAQYLQSGAGIDEAEILALIEARAAAKAARNFAEADRIRAELAAQGVELKDSAQGTNWVRS